MYIRPKSKVTAIAHRFHYPNVSLQVAVLSLCLEYGNKKVNETYNVC